MRRDKATRRVLYDSDSARGWTGWLKAHNQAFRAQLSPRTRRPIAPNGFYKPGPSLIPAHAAVGPKTPLELWTTHRKHVGDDQADHGECRTVHNLQRGRDLSPDFTFQKKGIQNSKIKEKPRAARKALN